MVRRHPLAAEALLSAAAAALVATLLVWLGPPGSDLAAHAYQRTLFLEHGFTLWNNFWYAGRYSFVTYSVLYYPLAALLGIKLLAVATIALAALAFAVVLGREWGPTSRWSSRTFAVVWAGIVLSAAFPFALGAALALLALWALQARRRWRFAALTALTLAASPVAFLLLAIVVAGVALERRAWMPVAAIGAAGLVELVLWRLFPDGGRYPFSLAEASAAFVFCVLGLALTWRVEQARVLRFFFAIYLVAVAGAYVVPSAVGENVARLRFAAIPLAVLVFSLRRWRPLPVGLGVLAIAVAWNVTPLASGWLHGSADSTARAAAWTGPVAWLRAHLEPGYRVEAVDTVTHWPAAYLAEADLPIARGWFRQDDFPQNAVLYSRLGPGAYVRWLRSLGVAYVVLTRAQPDYSARAEARLVAGGRAGLREVYRDGPVTVYAVPRPSSIATGPGSPLVLSFGESRLRLRVGGGTTRIAVRWSPYWRASDGCLSRGGDGMLRLTTLRPRAVGLAFRIDAGRLLGALAGDPPACRLR
ncbi:MAG: hypothetical protein JOZ56_01460 [Actinobacteria bacterium]|nr:hypothetical protein [Actinomycetota bacterium]MBV8561736.1 hypothetical protein [Actinomycetota bacterium]